MKGSWRSWELQFSPNDMENCACEVLPTAVDITQPAFSWLTEIEVVAQKPFLSLRRCNRCGQKWQVDLVDKYQTCLAIKVDTSVEWDSFDDKPQRVEYLVNSRGGISDEKCVIQDCKNLALRSLAYCPIHAFDYAGLRE
jgi:hypothetical protein